MAPQPPPGGWPNRRADDVRIAQLMEENRLIKDDLKRALSQHADIEVNQDWISARRTRDIQTLILIGALVGAGFSWAIYTSGFAKAEELRKTQDKVAAQDTQIAVVQKAIDDLTKATDKIDKNVNKLLDRIPDAGPRRHR